MSVRPALALAAALGGITALATTAHAQAPGQMPGPPAPGYYEPAPPVRESVMARRWAIGLNLGAFTATPNSANPGDPDADANFRTAELSIRYRATYHLELELLLNGGRQVLDDDSDGDLAMGGGTLGLRYRFRVERPWNWWLMGGLGGTIIERHDSSEAERDGAMRPHVAVGVGLERRFRRFAIQAEFRMLGIGPRDDAEMTVVDGRPDGSDVQIPPAPSEELTGGSLTFGASFYF
jgi:hypothetical protein